jgi:hypothetical protein
MVWHSYHRAQIKEKQSKEKKLSSSRFNFMFSQKPCKLTYSDCTKYFQSRQLSKKDSGDRSSLTTESGSNMFLEDLLMKERPVKSPYLRLTFSSSFELEELSLEKSKSLKTIHARDIIFCNFFFLSLKRYFFLSSPLLLESF